MGKLAELGFMFIFIIFPVCIGSAAAFGYHFNSDFSIAGPYQPNNEIIAGKIIEYTNQLRLEHGLQPLIEDKTMNSYATQWSHQLHETNQFHHSFGFYGENIAMYSNMEFYSDEAVAQQIINQWKNSPGHYANMMTPEYTLIGVGADCNRYGCYATQEFY